ncbi:TauD/TfdA family dioxygenase [Streptomyces sp. NPDC006285]|uniref:TauD/TfdA family dioxygenase n=1 Tax=Streptomyces sp. NPDC006285 TaxID=3364742 RepID=UPI0036A61580
MIQPDLTGLSALFTALPLGVATIPGAPAPLLLTARAPRPDGTLSAEMAHAIGDLLRKRGALLLRGLDITTAPAASQLCDEVFAGQTAFTTGEHPQVVDGHGLYEPVRYAPEEKLMWHHENSFNATWPQHILFVAARPADEGGATPIVDGRLMHSRAPIELREALQEHGIIYERACDGRAGRSWQQIYATCDPQQAHDQALANGEALTFSTGGARISAHRPAFQDTPYGASWFNQLLHWHPQALPTEIRQMIADKLLPAYRTCRLGNGEAIPANSVETVRQLHAAAEFPVRWRTGDVLMIDNAVFAHGRDPYRGQRRHYVRMAGTRITGPAPRRQHPPAAPPAL